MIWGHHIPLLSTPAPGTSVLWCTAWIPPWGHVCLLEDSAATPLVPRSTAKAAWCPWGCSTRPCHQHWCPAMLPFCVPAVGGEHLAPGISQDL